jgi:exopolysaccharide biosynthesis polyprenyl glycosylphosphotransferase
MNVAEAWLDFQSSKFPRKLMANIASISPGATRARRPPDPELRGGLSAPEPAACPDEVDALGDIIRRERIYRRLLGQADGIAVLLSLSATAFLTHVRVGWIAVATVPLVILVAKLQGLYDRDELVIFKSTLSEMPRLLQVAAIMTVGLDFTYGATAGHGRVYGLIFSLVLCAVTTLAMLVARGYARNFARRTAPEERCLIIGDSASCVDLGARINELRGVNLLGAVSIEEVTDLDSDLRELVDKLGVQRLVVAPSNSTPANKTLDLVRHAKAIGARVSIVPTVMAAVGGSVVIDDFAGFTLLGVPRFGLSRSSAAIKRTFDFCGASLGLVLVAPFMLVISALIKGDSGGPVIFRQVRIGRDGKPFSMLKFRSMIEGADDLKPELLLFNEATHGLFKIADDPRITRTGRWLRRTRLDEFPQLVNVLRGEMSLVGPRPLVIEEDERVVGLDRGRLHLTPGMTGPWQILGPMRVPLPEMAKLDYLYIANWSLWRDIEILLQTAKLVFERQGL